MHSSMCSKKHLHKNSKMIQVCIDINKIFDFSASNVLALYPERVKGIVFFMNSMAF